MEENNFAKGESIKLIDKRIKSFVDGYRQNLALLGDDEDQIFYILNKYLFTSQKQNELIYIYVNASYIGDREFFKNVAYSILSEYISSRDSLDKLITIASPLLPYTVDFIKENLKTTNFITFLKILELINKFINETSKKCIFIIEEFTQLKYLFKNFHQDFSKFIIFQKKCMTVITSSEIEEAQKILSTELNFLFGNFEKINLNDTTFLDNYLYLRDSLKEFGPTPFFISFFVNNIGTNIAYYDIITKLIKKHYTSDEIESIIEIIKNSLYDKDCYFFQRFIKKIDFLKDRFKNYVAFVKILLAISNGYIRKKEIGSLNICEAKGLSLKLQKMVELNYLTSLGNVYRIKDELFSFWLSHIFCFDFYPSILEPQKRYYLFKTKLNETIEIYKDSFFKDKIRRILELIGSFKDDSLKIGKNRIRLPHIERTKIIFYPERKVNFLIGEGKKIIFVGIKEDTTDDMDILDYIEKTGFLKRKNIKRIFIALGSFTTSAKLIAKENKLIIWDANEINHLLRIYRKPIIINENINNF